MKALLLIVAGACLVCTAGCGNQPSVRSISINAGAILDHSDPSCYTIRHGEHAVIKLLEKDGFAAFQFGSWTLVFEAIPAESMFRGGTIMDSRTKTIQLGDFRLSLPDLDQQTLKQVADSFSVNGCNFQFTDSRTKLVVATHTYEAGEAPKTIIIAKDGSTREKANE